MTVKNVVCSAIKIMGDYNLYNYLLNGDNETEVYRQDKDLLITAFNQALETAVHYYPVQFVENFLGVKDRLKYSEFKYNPYRILKVDAPSGYKIYATEIIASGNVTVTYYYLPSVSSLEENNPLSNTPVSKTTLAYGVLSEFMVYKGRFEEAVTYFDKFLNALKNSANFKRKGKVKLREWF